MKRSYLGDANDHLKGSLHRLLVEAHALGDLFAVPMVTEKWKAEDFVAYARLLALPGPERVMPKAVFSGSRASRRGYFEDALAGIPRGADVFLDPDTGLKKNGRAREKHLSIDELGYFITASPKRLVVVYDESRDHRMSKRRHVHRLGKTLRSQIGPTVAYSAGRNLTVFMVSQNARRIAQVRKTLRGFLGCAARTRVHAFS